MTNTVRRIHSAIRARLAADESGFTLPEVLVTIVIMSTIVGAVSAAFVVGAQTSTQASTRLQESQDAQQASAYFVADASNANYFSKTDPKDSTCPHESGNNVALFEWTEGPTVKAAYYVKVGTPAELVRRYCEGTAVQSAVTLGKNLGSTTVTCPPAGSCSTTPSAVEMTVVESSGYDYTLRASPRPKEPTSGMGGIAIYLGSGGLTLGGNSQFNVPSGVVHINGGDTECNGTDSEMVAPDGFHNNGGTHECAPTQGSLLPDPLIDVPAITTAPPAASLTPTTTTTCGTSQDTYQPGSYDNPANGGKPVKLENACLASGIYYLDDPHGSILNNVSSAGGGVLIYVAQASLELNGANTLCPMTTGDWAGITVFLGRGNNGNVAISSTMTIYGTMYGPDGRLHMQSDNAELFTGGVNFKELLVQGNGSGLILV